MTSLTFVSLLLIMLFILYRAGFGIQKNGKIISSAGIAVICIYTLNEGLRFGRGIDYNLYYNHYIDIAAGREVNLEFVFIQLCRFFISLDFSFQALILFMSFMFILSLLNFMQNFRDKITLALPFFVFFSRSEVENMVRWYLAFSFFLFGLSDLIKREKLSWRYFLFSLIGCSIHYAILPIPFAFFIIYQFKHIMLKPYISIPLFLSIYLLFKAEAMSQFVDIVNILANASGERFAYYGDSAEYWLTGGFAGEEVSGKIGISEMTFLSVLVILGHRIIKSSDRKYIFSYNLFILGFLLLPIARKLELVGRYEAIFFFFRAIVLAVILYTYYIGKNNRLTPAYSAIILIVLLYVPVKSIKSMLTDNPMKYLYVWDKSGMTPDKMYEMWIDDIHRGAEIGKSE